MSVKKNLTTDIIVPKTTEERNKQAVILLFQDPFFLPHATAYPCPTKVDFLKPAWIKVDKYHQVNHFLQHYKSVRAIHCTQRWLP